MKDKEKVTCEHEWTECLVYHADGFCPSGPQCIRCGKYQREERGVRVNVSTTAPISCEHNWIMYEWRDVWNFDIFEEDRVRNIHQVTKLICTNCLEKKDV